MSRDVDALLDELREALDVEPLAGFEGRLKAHVVATRPAAASGVSRTVLPALIAAGVALGAALWSPGGVQSPATGWSPPAAVAASYDQAVAPSVTGTIAIGASSTTVLADDGRAPEAGGQARRAGGTDRAALAAAAGTETGAETGGSATPAFFVLVPPDQAQTIDRLLAARLAGRQVSIGPAATFVTATDGEVPLLEVQEIQIVPLPGGPPTVERKPR